MINNSVNYSNEVAEALEGFTARILTAIATC